MMNRKIIALILAAVLILLASMPLSAVAAEAEYQRTQGVTLHFGDQKYTDQVKATWDEEYLVPPGGIRWDGTPEFLFVTPSLPSDIVNGPEGSYVTNQLVFKTLRTGLAGELFFEVEQIAAKFGARIMGYIAATDDFQIEFVEDKSFEELLECIEQLKKERLIDSSSVNFNVVLPLEFYGYTQDETLWGGDGKPSEDWVEGNNWGAEFIQAPFAWKYKELMSPVRVGIIDGYFEQHKDMPISIISNSSDSNNDHGMNVAGIVGATHNSIGIDGVYPFSELYGRNYDSLTRIDTIASITEMVDQYGIKVINCSWGIQREYVEAISRGEKTIIDDGKTITLPAYSQIVSEANELGKSLESLVVGKDNRAKKEFVICVAAGNAGIFVDVKYSYYFSAMTTPQDAIDRIVLVGSIAWEGGPVYDLESQPGDRIDILAPGYDIYSLSTDDGYVSGIFGTSFASPQVTGVAAMVWSVDNAFSGAQVKQFVLNSYRNIARRPDDEARRVSNTYPLLNAKNAVLNALVEAQDGSIRGSVVELMSSPEKSIPGVSISIQPVLPENNAWVPLTSNNDGTFSVKLAPGFYKVLFQKDGYTSPAPYNVAIAAGKVTNIGRILLSPSSAQPTPAPTSEPDTSLYVDYSVSAQAPNYVPLRIFQAQNVQGTITQFTVKITNHGITLVDTANGIMGSVIDGEFQNNAFSVLLENELINGAIVEMVITTSGGQTYHRESYLASTPVPYGPIKLVSNVTP